MIGRKPAMTIVVVLSVTPGATAADLIVHSEPRVELEKSLRNSIEGRVAVIDGRTLWFPKRGITVRLAEIDSCELPQWSFDPHASTPSSKTLSPVPCGALSKAWLKRTISNSTVRCVARIAGGDEIAVGVCNTRGRDLALEMLHVGWAKLASPFPKNEGYWNAQRFAISARYGMWGTYVLDMAEWRRKAIDKTLGRRPRADLNLLADRESEISPPFADARRQPARRDR